LGTIEDDLNKVKIDTIVNE